MSAPTMRTFSYIVATVVVGGGLACGGDDNIGPVSAVSPGGTAGSPSSGTSGGSAVSGNAAGAPDPGGSGVGGSSQGVAGSNAEIADASDEGPPALGGDAGPAGRDLSTNRNAFFGESRCASANVLLCEDFESGAIDKGTWKVTGAPVIDGLQKARGSHALHITM